MGNHNSSCLTLKSSHKTKIIDSNGNVRQVKVPMKAAEVMIEEPGHVVSLVDDLIRTQRVSILRADDDLEAGKLYMLFPVVRVNGKVKDDEVAIIKAVCHQKNKKIACLVNRRKKTRVAQVLPAEEVDMGVKTEEPVSVSGGVFTGFSGCRLRNQQQWSPVLESISEV